MPFIFENRTITMPIITHIICDRCGKRFHDKDEIPPDAFAVMTFQQDWYTEKTVFCKECYDTIIDSNLHEPVEEKE